MLLLIIILRLETEQKKKIEITKKIFSTKGKYTQQIK